jgi:hypothetical protein
VSPVRPPGASDAAAQGYVVVVIRSGAPPERDTEVVR